MARCLLTMDNLRVYDESVPANYRYLRRGFLVHTVNSPGHADVHARKARFLDRDDPGADNKAPKLRPHATPFTYTSISFESGDVKRDVCALLTLLLHSNFTIKYTAKCTL